MKYQVHLTDSASADTEAAHDWIAKRSRQAAARWFNGLLDVITSLETFPRRCGVARESKKAGEEIRQFLYGRSPHVYRILFVVRSQHVYVLHVRHGARQTMPSEEIEIPPNAAD